MVTYLKQTNNYKHSHLWQAAITIYTWSHWGIVILHRPTFLQWQIRADSIHFLFVEPSSSPLIFFVFSREIKITPESISSVVIIWSCTSGLGYLCLNCLLPVAFSVCEQFRMLATILSSHQKFHTERPVGKSNAIQVTATVLYECWKADDSK